MKKNKKKTNNPTAFILLCCSFMRHTKAHFDFYLILWYGMVSISIIFFFSNTILFVPLIRFDLICFGRSFMCFFSSFFFKFQWRTFKLLSPRILSSIRFYDDNDNLPKKKMKRKEKKKTTKSNI